MIDSIVSIRKSKGDFKDFIDFCQKVPSKDLNKRAIESLIKSGAFDEMGANRAQLMAVYEGVLESVSKTKRRNLDGQIGLFDLGQNKDFGIPSITIPNIKEFDEKRRLSMEKETVGLYVTGHPLGAYEEILKTYVSTNSSELKAVVDELEEGPRFKDKQTVIVGGMVAEKSTKMTRNNQLMAFIRLEDLYGDLECVIFPNVFERFAPLIQEDQFILVKGTLDLREEEEPKILVNLIKSLDRLKDEKVCIKLASKK